MFEISTPLKKFNANRIKFGGIYPYVVRSCQNNGIRGFITEKTCFLNPAGTISFGQDTATIFYQDKAYFTGDKIKIMTFLSRPLNSRIACYLLPVMRKSFSSFSWGQSSFNEKILASVKIQLPVTKSDEIAFDYMEKFIAQLEAYLFAAGLDDCKLTAAEKDAVKRMRENKIHYKKYNVCGDNGIFIVNNTHSILQNEITPNSGKYPYVTAGEANNSINTYIAYKDEFLERGNSIMIGGKTLVITYQEQDYFSNDSHNLALYVKNKKNVLRQIQHFLVSSLYRSLKHRYSWGDSISKRKITNDTLMLPVTPSGEIDYIFMETLITAQEKLAISDVVAWKDREIATTKKTVDRSL